MVRMRLASPSRRTHLWRAAVATALAATLLAGAGTAVVYTRLDGNIADVDIDAALGGDRPEDSPNGSQDILVLGSDSRSADTGTGTGTGTGVHGSSGAARSDTAMIVHIAEDRDAATVVSLPRDTVTARPSCRRPDGTTAPAAKRAMFNQAYRIGGPACAVKTVEAMTGIRMDHYVEIDFQGFERLIDTLGGVDITTTEPISDEDSHLDLPAGSHTLDGEQALALVRTRKAIGDGSDLGRIQLQHEFMRALADQVGGIGLVAHPKRLYDLASAATSSVTTDSGLASVPELTALARDLQGIGARDTRMLTLPVTYDARDRNRVVPLTSQCERLWSALRRDVPVPASVTDGSAAKGEDPGGVVSPG